MKIVALGDIHGYNVIPILEHWKDADLVILLGDYLDAYERINPFEQIKNAENIFEYIDTHSNMITLLGNHDFYGLITEGVSRHFTGKAYWKACDLMKERWESGKFKVFHFIDNFAFSHAGITNTWWYKRFNSDRILPSISYYSEDTSYFGCNIMQGPCWIRPRWLCPTATNEYSYLDDDPLKGYIQVVGHTRIPQITRYEDIIYCDCLAKEHLLIEDNNFFAIDSNTFEKHEILLDKCKN